jgi:hypothetical protein
MGTNVSYKFYKTGQDIFMAPGTNTPYGSTEVTQQDFVNYINSLSPEGKQRITSNYSRSTTPGEADAFNQIMSGTQNVSTGISWGLDPVSGQSGWGRWDETNATNAANEAAVAAGTMKKVPIGSGFGYIPVGSAAATNPLGVQQPQGGTQQTIQPSGTSTQTTQPDETANKIKAGERAILPDGRQFLKEADGTFRWIENPQVLGELINAGKVTGGMTQVSSESALGKIGSTLTMSEANGSDDLAIEKAIREIYQTNFGRQPTQTELDNQKNAINAGGQAAFDNLVNWATTHPQNVSATGKVSLPQSSQGEPLEPLDNTEDLVSQLPTELQSLYTQMSDYVQTLIDQGKQVNPNIEITPEMLSQFEQQAMTEYADYFSGEELGVLTDLRRTLDRNIQLTQQSEEDALRGFQSDYRGIGETAANQGITFSGERLRSEQELSDEANRQIQRNRQALQFGGEGLSLTAERNIGSSALSGFAFPTLSATPTTTAQGTVTSTGGATSIGSVRGDILGTLPSQEETAVSQRASQLEEIYRTRNLLSL